MYDIEPAFMMRDLPVMSWLNLSKLLFGLTVFTLLLADWRLDGLSISAIAISFDMCFRASILAYSSALGVCMRYLVAEIAL